VWLLTDSLSWPRGWLAVGVLWGTQVIGGLWFLKTDPDLLEERMSPGENSTPDKLATLLIVILLLCWFVANPLDVLLFQLLPPPPAALSLFGGLVLYTAGLAIVTWTFRTNSFAASVVTVQEERGQQVIDTGPYAYVRHPMYAGLIPLFAGLSLIMESSATALFVIPMVVSDHGVQRNGSVCHPDGGIRISPQSDDRRSDVASRSGRLRRISVADPLATATRCCLAVRHPASRYSSANFC
jgi:protein-S-isoprenylcysteine O-methyltransferase Ste14